MFELEEEDSMSVGGGVSGVCDNVNFWDIVVVVFGALVISPTVDGNFDAGGNGVLGNSSIVEGGAVIEGGAGGGGSGGGA